MNTRKLISACGAVLSLFSVLSVQGAEDLSHFESEEILSSMRRVNTYALEHPVIEWDRNWIRATWYSGVTEAYHATGDKTYLEQAKTWGERHGYQIGHEHSGFNRLFSSMTWMELYLLEKDPKMMASTVEALELDLPFSPEIGKIWYGHEPHCNDAGWIYADGFYSSTVFTMLYQATGDQKYLDYLHDAFWTGVDAIFDEEESLYYRDPNYIKRKSPYGGKILWSRGNGWVFAGLPRILKHLPKEDPNYDRYLDLYKRMAKSLAERQQDDGFWRANLGDADHYTMPESSGTAFFIAGFGWGIREGVLDEETYLPVVIRGWDALISAVHPDGLLGWVQPVDAAPRPSNPRTTQEYGAGLFLSAASQVYLLTEAGLITPETIQAALPQSSQMLPAAALTSDSLTKREHPLSEEIEAFQKNQSSKSIEATGLTKKDYLDVIAGQVTAMRAYQNEEGRIIDPVDNAEKYYSTPCYAHSVAVLVKAGYPLEEGMAESGMKALDVSVADLAKDQAVGGHADFYTWPIVFAYELFEPTASAQRKATWKEHLAQVDPSNYDVYREPIESTDHSAFYKAYSPHFASNWNLVHTSGEWGRSKLGLSDSWYVDYCLTMQLPSFTPHGMYNEWGESIAYDLFSRHYLAGMLQKGYDSFLHTTYRDILWRGAWTSLFMQSPSGELPAGFRSTHHIWNEAEQAVVFEIYASAYAKEGRTAEAGAFKRAANLSLASIKNWIREDGTGYVVKNRYPIEAKHGYEVYSAHSCYNLLAMSMLAQAWQFAEDGIEEAPCPADVGGFAVSLRKFHKVFANTDGTYIEYETNGDHKYNPTGLIRVHFKGGNPQLGPSDGVASHTGGEGVNFAVGPAWKNAQGEWTKLADLGSKYPKIDILKESTESVEFKVTHYIGEKGEKTTTVTERFTVTPNNVSVAVDVRGEDIQALRVYYPMLVTDGANNTKINMDDQSVSLELLGGGVVFETTDSTLTRSGEQYGHRNGVVELLYFEVDSNSASYRLSKQ